MTSGFGHGSQLLSCNPEDIQAAHQRLLEQEEEVNIQLDALLSRQCHLEAKLRSVTKALPNLKVVHSDATNLCDMISYTSSIAENVSAKVRKLDLARGRVSECQRRVLDVLDVQLCSEGVSAALRTEDYEKAAAHVHRYLSMDQCLLWQTAEDVAQGTSLWDSLRVLQDACSKLREVIVIRFEEAVASEDVASAERFFKLFPLLGMQDEGLRRFSVYLCSKLKETGEKNLKAVSSRSWASAGVDKRASVAFADALTLLFEGIARLIEIHQPLVETYYGPGRMLAVIKHLQEECDRQSYQLFLEFNRQRNMSQWLKTVRDALRIASTAPSSLTSSASTSSLTRRVEGDGGLGSSVPQQSRPDPRELDVLLGEMAIMHARAGLYIRFIRRRVMNDLEVGIVDAAARAEKVKELESGVLGPGKGGGLCLAMQELLGNYSLLERYYLEESVAKAIAMDSLIMSSSGSSPEGDTSPPLTSMLDDTFFIIRKCIRRAASSGSLDGTCAVINMACSLLSGVGETGLGGTLRRRLRSGYPTSLYLDLSQVYALASSALHHSSSALHHSSSLLLQSASPSGVSHLAGIGGSGASMASSGGAGGIDSDRARLMFLAHFNDADVAVEYVETLRRTLLEEIPPTLAATSMQPQPPPEGRAGPGASPLDMLQGSEKAKLESCLVEGLSTVVAELRDLGKIGAHHLSSSAVKPRIAPWVDAFTTHNHTPSEEEFLVLEGEDSFVGGLLSNLASLLSSFEGSLTPYNFDLFITMVTSELAARMEKVIFKSQFNRLGGLLLDREVRALTSFLTSKMTGSVREKFSRLSQMATLLNLEKVSEVSDYWTAVSEMRGGSGVLPGGTPQPPLSWQLSAAEVRKVLALRVDFRSEDIKRLKL
ncbi:conserved oligomeric Golgi complex subunit 4 [Hetaerina americana]|uniref:conserved oligomeric Golgi complex subunit 4 n=1 Tax=Hetaerina americana TaxID=62018 RepID=UPI003A7F40B9